MQYIDNIYFWKAASLGINDVENLKHLTEKYRELIGRPDGVRPHLKRELLKAQANRNYLSR